MKKTFLIFCLLFSTIFYGQEFKTPNAYFNYIGVEKEAICKLIWKYNVALAHSKNINEVNKLKRVLIENIRKSYEKIGFLSNGFNGDLEYKNNYLEYLTISEKQINMHFEKISNLKNYEAQSFEELEKYLLERAFINKSIKYQSEVLNKNQVDFAKRYGFNFEESKNELSKKMKIAVEVFDNHTAMYLIYLKVYVNQSNLRNAIKSKNLQEAEKINRDLEKYTTEGLEKLKDFKPYGNDKSLVEATNKSLEVAKNEYLEYGKFSIEYIKDNIKFKENKTKIYSESDNLKKNELINEFNKVISLRNENIKKYNDLTLKFDSNRLIAFNNWNRIGEEFIAKYVPEN